MSITYATNEKELDTIIKNYLHDYQRAPFYRDKKKVISDIKTHAEKVWKSYISICNSGGETNPYNNAEFYKTYAKKLDALSEKLNIPDVEMVSEQKGFIDNVIVPHFVYQNKHTTPEGLFRKPKHSLSSIFFPSFIKDNSRSSSNKKIEKISTIVNPSLSSRSLSHIANNPHLVQYISSFLNKKGGFTKRKNKKHLQNKRRRCSIRKR